MILKKKLTIPIDKETSKDIKELYTSDVKYT
jgi:hypothetical protein